MIDITSEDYVSDYKTLLGELEKYSKVLSKKKKFVALTKSDLIEPKELKKIKTKKIPGYKGEILIFSSATKDGIEKMLDVLWKELKD